MALYLAVGAANAGKTTYVLEQARSVVRSGERVRLLLPGDLDVSRAIMATAHDMPVGLDISTFDDYLNDIWAHHGDGRVIASPAHRLAVLEESVIRWKPVTASVRPNSQGTLRLLSRVVQRCAEAERRIDPGVFRGTVAHDIASLAAIYQQLLNAAGFIERAEAHGKALQLLGHVRLPALLAIDGFTGLTAAQESFAVEAAGHATVIISLVHDATVPATSGATAQVERLVAAGAEPMTFARGEQGDPELTRISTSLGRVGDGSVTAGGAVVLCEAWGSSAEAARVAREVQDAERAGIPLGSIAVVYRDVAPRMQELGRAFAEACIAVEFDTRVPFGSTPLGRALLLVLRLESLPHNELMDLLRSPYSAAAHSDLDAFDASERGHRETRSARKAALSWFSRQPSPTAAFLRCAEWEDPRASGEKKVSALFKLVSEMIANARRGRDAAAHHLVLDAGAARVFIDAAEALAAAGSLNAGTLHAVLDQSTVAMSSTDDPDRVQVMGAERARARRYRCVILAGLRDGEFPRLAGESALSDPGLLSEFARAGVDLGDRSGIEEERLLFYQVITRATERLVLSRQTNDENAKPLRGSVFIDEVLDLYRDPVTRCYFAGEPPVRRLGLDGLAEHPDAPLSERRALRAAALSREESGDERLSEASRRAEDARHGLSEAAKRSASQRTSFSASELEAYLKCPFLWCVQRLVQPRELDDRLDAAATGRLAHDIMKRVYEVFAERTRNARVTEQSMAEALAIHDEVAAECLALIRPASAVESALCRGVARRTKQLVAADATFLPGFVPLHLEWSFGSGPEGAPVDLDGFALSGRIDRLDSDGKRVVLTDYKSGSIAAEHGAARLDSEGLVQLSLYAAVVTRLLDLEVAGGVYRSFRGGKPRGFVRDDIGGPMFVSTDVMSSTNLRHNVERGIARAREAVVRMRSGDIAPDPLGGTCPRYCSAAPFCEKWSPGRG